MNPYQTSLWKKAPFVRLLIPLILSICIQKYFPISFSLAVISLFLLLGLFLVYYCLPLNKRFLLRHLHSSLLFGFVFFSAVTFNGIDNPKHHSSWFGNLLSQQNGLLLFIDEPFIQKKNFSKTTVTIKALIINQHIQPCKGKMLLYIKAANTMKLNFGDFIFISKTPQKIKPPDNPGAFDYQQFQADQQIYHQVFISENELIKIEYSQLFHFYKLIYCVKEQILSILKNFIHQPQELGIAEALLIGYKNDLDNELVQSYTITGVVHIIAISGLHLGLIYIGLIWIFDKTPLLNRSTSIKYGTTILCIWIFAILTGASASVLRSAVMFTCIAIGKIMKQNSQLENSLAASAFILLSFNTNFLWDLGFQLSYLAIIGIVLFQKLIQDLFFSKYYLIRKIWEMISITIAAQIMTFPICLYNFHQFPTLFLISNLIAVPLSTIILFAEVFLIAVNKITSLSIFVGMLIEKMIKLMNYFISYLHHLPFSTVQNIYSDIYTTSILYALLILLTLFILQKNKSYLKAAFILFTAFSSLLSFASINVNNQKKVVFYKSKSDNSIDFILGKSYYYYSSKSELLNNLSTRNILSASRRHFGSDHSINNPEKFIVKGNLFQINKKLLLIVNKNVKYKSLQNPVNIDVLYLSDNPPVEIPVLIQSIKPKIILFAASNKKSRVEQWKNECKSLGINSYSIYENGAYVYEIE